MTGQGLEALPVIAVRDRILRIEITGTGPVMTLDDPLARLHSEA